MQSTANEQERASVAVIGLGAMGLPMARRLAERFDVAAFDVNPARRALVAESGVQAVSSVAAAVTGVDVVLTAVRNGAQLTDALFGPDGAAARMKPGAVLIVTSTVGIEAVRDLDSRLAETPFTLVDAPVSGGPLRAGEGDLLVLVGGASDNVAAVRPVLDQLASTVVIVGDRPGDGQAMKTVNQLLCGVHIAAAAEALTLARALGLDGEATLAALGSGAAGSFMLANRGPRILQALSGDEAEVLSRLDIFVKDMGLVSAAARGLGLAAPVAAATEQLFLLGQARGLGQSDDSAVARLLLAHEEG